MSSLEVFLLGEDCGIEIMSKFFAMSAQCLIAAGRSAFTLYLLCWEFFFFNLEIFNWLVKE